MKINNIITTFFAISFCSGVTMLGMLWYLVHCPLLEMGVFREHHFRGDNIILDRYGKELGRFEIQSQSFVSIHQVPQHVIQAFVAAEDWNFFKHTGLSIKGICRSILVNIYHGKKMQGASTITQQLVKLYFLNNKKTFLRKLKEQLYALLIEHHYSKEQILEYYLNALYFGPGVYGIEAAAQRFWNKSSTEISRDQAALLAGMICSPGNYSPLTYPLSAEKRRNVILKKMEKLQFITSEQSEELQKIPVMVVTQATQHNKMTLPLAVHEYIRTFIEMECGKSTFDQGGLIIQTTLDADIQKKAQTIMKQHKKKLRLSYGGDLDGALITLDSLSSAIRALIPGFDYNQTYFNRALFAKRQSGSLFKPLIYAAALEQGMSFCDTAVDEPLTINFNGTVWKPRNSSRTFTGTMTLARALVYSNNIITIKVLLQTGIERVIELAKKCHIADFFDPYPSLALGCVDASLVDMAALYGMFADGGVYHKPYLIASIKNHDGKKLYKHKSVTERVLPVKIAHQVVQVLKIACDRKSHIFKRWIDCEAFSKTGTTNDSRTCWFVGATPEFTTAVYVGCDDNRPLGKTVFPVATAFPLWLDLHVGITTEQKHFMVDATLEPIFVNSKTGEVCPDSGGEDTYQLFV